MASSAVAHPKRRRNSTRRPTPRCGTAGTGRTSLGPASTARAWWAMAGPGLPRSGAERRSMAGPGPVRLGSQRRGLGGRATARSGKSGSGLACMGLASTGMASTGMASTGADFTNGGTAGAAPAWLDPASRGALRVLKSIEPSAQNARLDGTGRRTTQRKRNPMSKSNGATALGEQPSNDAAEHITPPYIASVTIEGTAALLFHRWSNEDVAEKANAAKGSKAKKTDNVESYVYRDDSGVICVPGVYLTGSITNPQCGAAKYRQDPRSPRKSALDLYKAGVVALTELATIIAANGDKATDWDYLDQRRVVVQRSAITRSRPAFLVGWRATFELSVLLPEYIAPAVLHSVLSDAGRFVGIADFRPTYGRFQVVNFEVVS